MEKTIIRNIDPNVYWDAKIYAAQTRKTLGEVFTEALQLLFQENEPTENDYSEFAPRY